MLSCCRLFFVLILALITPSLVIANHPKQPEAGPWTVDDVIQSEQASEFHISPDCRWVIWTKSTPNLDKSEMISQLMRSSLTSDEVCELTRGNDSCTNPRWSPDGK